MTRRVHRALARVLRDGVPLLAVCAIAIAIGCNRASPYRIGVVLDYVGMEGAALAAATIMCAS